MYFLTCRWLIAATKYVICESYGNIHNPGQDSLVRILLSKSTAFSNLLKESEEDPTVPRAPTDKLLKFI